MDCTILLWAGATASHDDTLAYLFDAQLVRWVGLNDIIVQIRYRVNNASVLYVRGLRQDSQLPQKKLEGWGCTPSASVYVDQKPKIVAQCREH